MQINIENGAVSVKNSPNHTPRCLDILTFLCGREVEVTARHWAAREAGHEDGARDAYISVGVKGDENEWEVPKDEEDSFRRRATEQTIFFDIKDARALRDALTIALARAKS